MQPGKICLTPGKRIIKKISPVASLLMNSRPLESKASPAGRKQPPGHCVSSGLAMISVPAIGLVVGWPSAPKSMRMTRYPSGGDRSLLVESASVLDEIFLKTRRLWAFATYQLPWRDTKAELPSAVNLISNGAVCGGRTTRGA